MKMKTLFQYSWISLMLPWAAWGSSTTSKQIDSFNATNGTSITVPSNAIWTVGNGGTGAASLTVHGVVVGNSTSAVNVTLAGTSGQVLTSNGASADPTFQTASGGGTWVQEFSSPYCNGSTTVFTLANTPTSNAIVQAHLDGTLLTQGSGNDYTISGATVTLGSACATGQQLYFVYAH